MIPTSIGRSGKISINLNVALLFAITLVTENRLLNNVTCDSSNLWFIYCTSKLVRFINLT